MEPNPKKLRGMPALSNLAAARARQDELLKEPALPCRQKQALNTRAVQRFGVNATFVETFEELKMGVVFPVILKYTNGYMPPNPTLRDIGRGIGGGYAQAHVTLTLAKIVSEIADNKAVVELEKPTFLSFGNGPRETRDRFLFCKDGTVQYEYQGAWKEWSQHIPLWEFVAFPALEVVCSGFDL